MTTIEEEEEVEKPLDFWSWQETKLPYSWKP
jgi:hypothetical protein